jgi:hypothetical protein
MWTTLRLEKRIEKRKDRSPMERVLLFMEIAKAFSLSSLKRETEHL